MNTNQTEKDIFKTIFSRMPEEELPVTFHVKMMQQIQKEAIRIQRRSKRLRVLALIMASLLIIGMAVATFIYTGVPQIRIKFPDITISSFYLYIGVLSLILLFADYLFRQSYYKKHHQ